MCYCYLVLWPQILNKYFLTYLLTYSVDRVQACGDCLPLPARHSTAIPGRWIVSGGWYASTTASAILINGNAQRSSGVPFYHGRSLSLWMLHVSGTVCFPTLPRPRHCWLSDWCWRQSYSVAAFLIINLCFCTVGLHSDVVWTATLTNFVRCPCSRFWLYATLIFSFIIIIIIIILSFVRVGENILC